MKTTAYFYSKLVKIFVFNPTPNALKPSLLL